MAARKTTATKTTEPKTVIKSTGEEKPTEEALEEDNLELLADQPEDSVDLVQSDEGDAVVDPSDAGKTVQAEDVETSGNSTGNSKGPHIHVGATREIEVLVGGFYHGGRSLPVGARISVVAKLAGETKEEQIALYGQQMFRAV